MEPVLVAKKLSKKYGKVVALESANLELYPGEVLGVIGDNGAGKSTLIKVLCGAVIPDSGEILLDGKPVTFTSPIEARTLGIETVYQNLALSPALSITDNMFLGREIRQKGFMGKFLKFLDKKAMADEARKRLSELGLLTIQNINQLVETLSGGQRQGVAGISLTHAPVASAIPFTIAGVSERPGCSAILLAPKGPRSSGSST
mgnify:CR=1 FL=1